MARIRTIKPEFWQDYRLAEELTRDERLLYIGLWNEADDEGRFLAHPRRVLGVVFPYDGDLTEEWVKGALLTLQDTGRLVLYEVDGEPYGQLTKFNDHQRINKPSESKIPSPTTDSATITERSGNPTGIVTEASPRAREEQGTGNREVEGEQGTGKASPPRAYAREAVENLGTWIGEGGAEVIDRFVRAHPRNAGAVESIHATYARPSMQGEAIWKDTPAEERKIVLGDALETLAGEGQEYKANFFRRVIRDRLAEGIGGGKGTTEKPMTEAERKRWYDLRADLVAQGVDPDEAAERTLEQART